MTDFSTLADKLAESIGEYKPSGEEFVYKVCPECGNQKRNFQVNFSKNVFHCWACNYRGKAFYLLQKYHIQFDSSVFLSGDAPLKIKKNVPEFAIPDNVTEIANSVDKDRIFSYLRARNITDEDIIRYQIKWWKDKYRLFFPIMDPAGRIVFYSARTIYKGVKPKYLTPERPKSDLIFMYRGEKEDTIYIVEGVFDGIAANKLGKTVVMLLGSSIGSNIISYLKLYSKKVILCLDPDMVEKQYKYEKELKNVLGKDMVDSMYLREGDVAECGLVGGLGFEGLMRSRL